MPTVLIVDDSPVERRLAGRLLETGLTNLPGLSIQYAADGIEALAAMQPTPPDVVVTDLQMPEMGGLQLVEEIRGRFPCVPVVIMTAYGSEEIAVRALKSGAASYVPKHNLSRDLIETVEGMLSLTHDLRAEQRVLSCLTRAEIDFVLENDTSLVPGLVRYVQDNLKRSRFCDDSAAMHVTVALREALVNAIEHGNLEVSSELRDVDDRAFHRLVAERRLLSPYKERRVHFRIRESPAEVTFLVRDEGPGFSPASLPDPLDPVNLERAHGRGLLLIRTFMDDVQHNSTGNEITMTKRRSG